MIMIAVQDFDVDAGFSHPAREQTELTGHVLLQSLNKHLPFREDVDGSPFQCPARRGSVREQKMATPWPPTTQAPPPSTLTPARPRASPISARAPCRFSKMIVKSFMTCSPDWRLVCQEKGVAAFKFNLNRVSLCY
jgi:hypothetical protein